MDLFTAALIKGLIFGLWAIWDEWRNPELVVLDEQGGCYEATQPLLCLPAPDKT